MAQLRYEFKGMVLGAPLVVDYDPNNRLIAVTDYTKDFIAMVTSKTILELGEKFKRLERTNRELQDSLRRLQMATAAKKPAVKKKMTKKTVTKKVMATAKTKAMLAGTKNKARKTVRAPRATKSA